MRLGLVLQAGPHRFEDLEPRATSDRQLIQVRSDEMLHESYPLARAEISRGALPEPQVCLSAFGDGFLFIDAVDLSR